MEIIPEKREKTCYNSHMKKIFIAVCLLIILGVTWFIILPKTLLKPKPVHFHAGFQVYKDDKLVDLTGPTHMHEEPCTVNGKPIDNPNANEQEEKAHLHDHVGDVAHVHRTNATWRDLFTNIKYPLSNDVTGYINGKKIPNILDKKITAYDSAMFFVGKHSREAQLLKHAVPVSHIKDIEKRSETCSS